MEVVPVDPSCNSELSSVPRAGVVAVANIIKVVVVEESVVNVICDEPFLETVHAGGLLGCQLRNWRNSPTQQTFIFLAVIRQSGNSKVELEDKSFSSHLLYL